MPVSLAVMATAFNAKKQSKTPQELRQAEGTHAAPL
jgi:hypothetical protein